MARGNKDAKRIEGQKKKFLEYYEDLPIKQAAADHTGVHIDTVYKWEKNDKEFSRKVLEAKSEFARKHGKKRPDNLLTKLYPEMKPDPQELKITEMPPVNFIIQQTNEPTPNPSDQHQPNE